MKNKVINFFQDYRSMMTRKNQMLARSEKGQVLFFFAIIAMVLVMLSGTITDYGLSVRNAVRAQTAADAAALAAATWTARCGNIAQQINGVHWDINYTLAQVITLSADICMIVIAVLYLLSLIPLPAFAALSKVADGIKEAEKVIIEICNGIHKVTDTIFDILNGIIPIAAQLISMLHANLSAGNNGSAELLELIINAVRNIPGMSQPVQDILKGTEDILDMAGQFIPGIHAIPLGTLGPIIPFIDTSFGKAFEKYKYPFEFSAFGVELDFPDFQSGGGEDGPIHNYLWTVKHAFNSKWANPYHVDCYAPFTAVMTFWMDKARDCEWSDSFIIECGQQNFIQNKLDMIPSKDDSNDNGLSLWDISIEGNIIDAIVDGVGDLVEKALQPIKDAWNKNKTLKTLGTLAEIVWENIIFMDLDKPIQDEEGKEPIKTFSYLVAVKSEVGSFLKMFGPVIGQDTDNMNVPMSFAVATAQVRGHRLHPGGMYRNIFTGNINDITMFVVPFWISAWPLFTQSRLVQGYEGDMQAKLIPFGWPKPVDKMGKATAKITDKMTSGEVFKTLFKNFFDIKPFLNKNITNAAQYNRYKKTPLTGDIFGVNH